ncbi:MAG: hypothetical protein IJX26_02405 [Clostridia bacterium]|nr:hypothetical protein [Clostridia bacterium]
MKSFLTKKPVMISFIVAAVVVLVAYIAMLVRPIIVGMTYTGKIDGVEQSIKIDSSKKLTVEFEDFKESYYYVENDGKIVIDLSGMVTKDTYKDWKKEVKENWDLVEEEAFEVSAFSAKVMDEKYTCTGAIVFAIIGGIVAAGLATFATLSVVYTVKEKRA